MNCKDVDKILIDFLSGEATQEEKDFALEHISSCQKCRDKLAALTDIEDKLRFVFKASTVQYSVPTNALESIKRKIAEEQTKATKQGLVESIQKLIEYFGKSSLFPKKLNWKTGLVSILVISLIVVLSVTIPMLFGANSEVLALDIALKDPQVLSAFGDREVSRVASDIIVDNNRAVVIFNIDAELLIIADVDLKTEELVQLFTLELTTEKKQEITEIARTDPRIQTLLEQGASIDSFYPHYTFFESEIIGPDGETRIENSVEFTVQIRIILPPEEYTAFINLDKGEVISFIPPSN